MNRRSFLRMVPTAGAAATMPAIAIATQKAPASREDLEKYYAFLWAEFSSVADELGIEQFDLVTMQRGGGQKGYNKSFGGIPPSKRAKAVLAVIAA